MLDAMQALPTLSEAIHTLQEYTELSDDPVESVRAAMAVVNAITVVCRETGIPLWFVTNMAVALDGEESADDLIVAWQEFRAWKNTIPDLEDREEEEGEGVPF